MKTEIIVPLEVIGYKCLHCNSFYEKVELARDCIVDCEKVIAKCKIRVGDRITVRKKHIKFSPLQYDLFIKCRFVVKAIKIQHGITGRQIAFVYENEQGQDEFVSAQYIVEKIK